MRIELLKAIYECFYTTLESMTLKQEAEKCHQVLIEMLKKSERLLFGLVCRRVATSRNG